MHQLNSWALTRTENYLATHVLFGLCYAFFNFGLTPSVGRLLHKYFEHVNYVVVAWVVFGIYVEWYLLPWPLWLLQWLIRLLLQYSMVLEYCCIAATCTLGISHYDRKQCRFDPVDNPVEMYVIWCYTKYICHTYVPFVTDHTSFTYDPKNDYLQIQGPDFSYIVQRHSSKTQFDIISYETQCRYFKEQVMYWDRIPLLVLDPVDHAVRFLRNMWITIDVHEFESLTQTIEYVQQNMLQRRPKPFALHFDGRVTRVENEKACAKALSERYAWVTHMLQPHIPDDLCELVLTYVKLTSYIS